MRVVDPRGAVVTHDSGSPRDQLLPFYRAVSPRSYLGWGKSHALGTGLGLTIGAKLAAPDKFAVNFMPGKLMPLVPSVSTIEHYIPIFPQQYC